MSIKGKVKRTFKSNKYLYKIWFAANQKKLDSTVRLPRKTDEYYFDGYPRSGNTFFRGLLKRAYPNLNGTSHLHCIAGLKIALGLQIKCLIIIRNPVDAVASNVYTKIHRQNNPLDKNIEVLCNELLSEWFNYYNFCNREIDSPLLNIITFETVINDEVMYLSFMEKHFGGIMAKKDDVISRFKETMAQKEKRKQVAYSSLPSKKKG